MYTPTHPHTVSILQQMRSLKCGLDVTTDTGVVISAAACLGPQTPGRKLAIILVLVLVCVCVCVCVCVSCVCVCVLRVCGVVL